MRRKIRRPDFAARNAARALDIKKGERSGKLTAREPIRSASGRKLWLCDCDCGGTTTVLANHFRKGRVKSCGRCGYSRSGETYRPKRGEHAGKLFRTIRSTEREYPALHQTTVQRAAEKPSRDLFDEHGKRRKIVWVKLKEHPVQGGPVTYYLDDDLKELDRRRKARAEQPSNGQVTRPEPWRNADGVPLLTEAQMVAVYGGNRDRYRVWARTSSKVRPGMALRSDFMPNPNRGGDVRGYCPEDWESIARGEEGTPGVGSGANAKRLREAKVRDAEALLPILIPRDASAKRSEVFALAKAKGLGKQFVETAFERLGGISDWQWPSMYWRLPANAYGTNGQPTVMAAATAARVKAKDKGGRPPSAVTQAVYGYCYERWSKGDNLAAIRYGAERQFGSAAPKEDSHVTEYAKRHAVRFAKPLVRPIK